MKKPGLPIPFGWYAVAFSDELSVKEVKPLYFFAKDLVLYRAESGTPVLLDAFCPHLGAHLGHGGEVHGESIACPFHGWQFDGNGMCTSVPYAKNMPKKVLDKPCIDGYPIREINGTIFAWYHPRKLAPIFEVDEVPYLNDPAWKETGRYEWEMNTCVQETGENGVDIAHFVYVHSSIEMPEAEIQLKGHHRVTTMISKVPAQDENGMLDTTGEKWEKSALSTTSCGPGMTYQTFDRGFVLFMQGTITPIDESRVSMRWIFASPADQDETGAFFAKVVQENVVEQVGHDVPIWENKIYQPNPILCDGDGPIAKYRKWFNQFYDDGDSSPVRLVKSN